MKDTNKKPSLLLHTCCAPCFTSVFEQLKDEFDITIFWFNPNIAPFDEYEKRYKELLRYAKIAKVPVILGDKYLEDNLNWNKLTEKFSTEKEGGARCEKCISYRLLATAIFASKNKFDCFATTLTVSPHKNSKLINRIGKNTEKKFTNLKFLDKDFKKNDGYKKSIDICKDYNIYRQNYCGCQYSQ